MGYTYVLKKQLSEKAHTHTHTHTHTIIVRKYKQASHVYMYIAYMYLLCAYTRPYLLIMHDYHLESISYSKHVYLCSQITFAVESS